MDSEEFKDELAARRVLGPLQEVLRSELPLPARQLDVAWRTIVRAMDGSVTSVNSTLPRGDIGTPGYVMRNRVPATPRHLRGRVASRRLWKTAAAVGTVAIAAMIMITGRLQPSRTVDAGTTYVTRDAEQATVTLRDGTRLMLSPRTTVRSHLGNGERVVDLVAGEVYFDVKHGNATPFIVRSGTTLARVLGTAFLVRHDAGHAPVRVAVVEGRVHIVTSVRTDSGVTLAAGQVGEVKDSTTRVSTVDDGVTSGVKRSGEKLVFFQTPVADVLATLSRWYGYQFRCTDPAVPKRKVTIVVSLQSSASALAALKDLLNVNLAVAGDTVTLTPHARARAKARPRGQILDVWTPTREVGR